MELKQIQLSDSLEDISRIGVIFFKQLSNGPVSTLLRERLEAFAEELRHSMADRRAAVALLGSPGSHSLRSHERPPPNRQARPL